MSKDDIFAVPHWSSGHGLEPSKRTEWKENSNATEEALPTELAEHCKKGVLMLLFVLTLVQAAYHILDVVLLFLCNAPAQYCKIVLP